MRWNSRINHSETLRAAKKKRNETPQRVTQCNEQRTDRLIRRWKCVFINVANPVLWVSVLGVGIFTALFQSLMNNSVLQRTFFFYPGTRLSNGLAGAKSLGWVIPMCSPCNRTTHNDQNVPERPHLIRRNREKWCKQGGAYPTNTCSSPLTLQFHPFLPFHLISALIL